MREEAVRFGESTDLVGILTDQVDGTRTERLPSVVLLNNGLTHRVGPARLSVKLARRLAEAGFVAFRFDFSGIGDSEARQDDLLFEKSSVIEAQEAMTVLTKKRGNEKFILMGMCGGANRAMRIACADPRVVGGVLINLQPHHGDRSHQIGAYFSQFERLYYRKISLLDPQRWARALMGQMNYRAIRSVIAFKLRKVLAPRKIVSSVASQLATDFRSLTDRGCRLLLVFSERDPGFEYVQLTIGQELRELSARERLKVEIVRGPDHTFALLWSQEVLLQIIGRWAEERFRARDLGKGRS